MTNNGKKFGLNHQINNTRNKSLWISHKGRTQCLDGIPRILPLSNVIPCHIVPIHEDMRCIINICHGGLLYAPIGQCDFLHLTDGAESSPSEDTTEKDFYMKITSVINHRS